MDRILLPIKKALQLFFVNLDKHFPEKKNDSPQSNPTHMKHLSLLALALCLILCNYASAQNSTITIKNKSDRYLTVKLMHGLEKKADVFKTDSVGPKGTVVFNVYETGWYFTKLRGIQYDKKHPENNDTIYSKDRPIQLVSDKKRGYTNLTIEFSVKEAKNNGSVSITRKEYDH